LVTPLHSYKGAAYRRVLRFLVLILLATITVASIVATVLLSVWILTDTNLSTSDRIAGSSAIVTSGALLLSLVAAYVAIRTYADTSGPPRIEVQLWSGQNRPNDLHFMARRQGGAALESTGSGHLLCVRLRNLSKYPAEDWTITLSFQGFSMSPPIEDMRGWTAVDSDRTGAIVAVQSNGGGGPIVGKAVRRIPDLPVGSLRATAAAQQSITVSIVARRGYRRGCSIEVLFVTPEWTAPLIASQYRDWL
jgi:hypothetical protein